MADLVESGRRRIVALSLKSYLGYAQTVSWLDAAARICRERPTPNEAQQSAVDVVLFPVAPALEGAVRLGREAGFDVGAQDVSAQPPGAFTGELPAALVAELGVRYVEIGHAERRYLFGDTPEVIQRKTALSVDAGLTPLVCVGEGRLGDTSPVSVEDAVQETVYQLEELLRSLSAELPLVVAYEPVWAIGAEEPAPVEHVRAVSVGLREALAAFAASRIIYGGTAGPGLFAQLGGAVDGLFLGRRAHDPAALGAVIAELSR